jgi:hypothetical protein
MDFPQTGCWIGEMLQYIPESDHVERLIRERGLFQRALTHIEPVFFSRNARCVFTDLDPDKFPSTGMSHSI